MSILGVWSSGRGKRAGAEGSLSEAHRDFVSMRYQLSAACTKARGCTGSRSRQGAPKISVPGMWFRGDRGERDIGGLQLHGRG
jgi:hypothetical protein